MSLIIKNILLCTKTLNTVEFILKKMDAGYIFVQLSFSSNTEQTAGQSSSSNVSVLSVRLADKKSSTLQMNLTRL
jgi:hypothetical protein